MTESVIIVGAGLGLSASVARKCAQEGMHVTLAARDPKKIETIADEIGAKIVACDSTKIDQVTNLFEIHDQLNRPLTMVVYNPSAKIRGPIHELDAQLTKKAIEVTCFGAFLVAQQATKRMLTQGYGSIFFTGASAGVKGFPNSSVFAMGKFGLRGLAQSLARELHPKNIHIGHFIIDGGIGSTNTDKNENRLSADAIADTYLQFHRQPRSTWSWEIELRPWIESF